MKSEGQKQSLHHEKRLAKALGGQRVAASGAFWSRKGDVRSDKFLLEHKWTGKTQYTLKNAVLKKVFLEAVLVGRTPILGVSFESGDNYIVMTEDDFLELIEETNVLRAFLDGEKGITEEPSDA